jgi:cardiolipin synthase
MTSHWVTLTLLVDLLIRVGLCARVIMRRRPVGVSLAWILLLMSTPIVGALVYVLVGERWLGRHRLKLVASLREPFDQWLEHLKQREPVNWSEVGIECQPVARVAEAALGIPALPGNHWELLTTTDEVFDRLIADIDNARNTCHLEFYIWGLGGRSDEVVQALIRAKQRGVACRVLVDGVGSRDFIRSQHCRELRATGVDVREALRANIFRMQFARYDLRLHRKIVVIDGEIAYTGSMNLVDPRFFKQDAGVGEWVDAMTRIEGPAVEALAVTFLGDWALEAEVERDVIISEADVRPLPAQGRAVIQVCPSGPTDPEQAVEELLLAAIYAARHELILTSPYFVPDETLAMALVTAAHRGVEVTLIVPAKVDSRLVRLATETFRGDLAAAGVRIMEFHGGLLHTKSVSVDGEFSLFGSLNLDPRSLYLNFEITLCIYDREFTQALRELQHKYLRDCTQLDMDLWNRRSFARRFVASVGRLLSPLL